MTLLSKRAAHLDRASESHLAHSGAIMPVSNSQVAPFKVSDFLSWQRSGSLMLSPAFQRNPTWDAGRKSFLIDTIIRGFPMPIIFLRKRKSNTKTFEPLREVVDGQQRLRTVIAFVAPNLLSDRSAGDDFAISKSHNQECNRSPHV